jgi:hypothetical protein
MGGRVFRRETEIFEELYYYFGIHISINGKYISMKKGIF